MANPHSTTALDLTGQRFGKLIVIDEAEPVFRRIHERIRRWSCLCDCGKKTTVLQSNLRAGQLSCGCLYKIHDSLSKVHQAEYNSWHNMMRRCYVPTNEKYPAYGARGITVCDQWHSFVSFYGDMGDRPTPKHTLERKNNDGPYSPENCKWALPLEQSNNTRRNKRITFDGQTLTYAQWERLRAFAPGTICRRIRKGWLPERAVTEPMRRQVNRLRTYQSVCT